MNIKEIAAIVFVIGLFFLYYKIMCYFRSKSIKKNINDKVTIIIEEESTVLIGANNQQIFKIKPNTMVYKRQKGNRYKIISFGSIAKSLGSKINSSEKQYHTVNFIRDKEQIEQINHFWYDYVTYLSLKAKECIGMSKLAIPSLDLRVEVSSERIRDFIFSELKKIETINKPKLFIILDVTKRG